jgi:cyclic pyranopterin phosphate synthase
VQHALLDSAVYPFEGILPDLDAPPIAARRAIDHTGLRLTLEGWRSLSLEERQKLTVAGVPERVDVETVALSLRRANPGPQRVSPIPDPDPFSPPEALVRALEPARTLDAKRWSRLRSLDRYALLHTYRRAVARSAFSTLTEVVDMVLLASNRPPSSSTAPPPPVSYRPPGYYSAVTASSETTNLGSTTRSSVPPPPVVFSSPASSPGPSSAGGSSLANLRPGGEVHMADIASKPKTERRAVATGCVRLRPEALAQFLGRETPKGEVFATSRIAAIIAAKRTHELIPLSHPVAMTHVEVDIQVNVQSSTVHVTVAVGAYDRTGVETEAMVAVSIGCLAIYDMLKGVDREAVVSEVKLLEKSSTRSGDSRRPDDQE